MTRFFRYLAAFFLSLFSALAQAEDFADIFTGTLVVWQETPVLIRCDLVKNAYILVNADMQTAPWVERIRALDASLEKPVSAMILGSYREIDGKNHLIVRSAEGIRKGNSCHFVPPEAPFNLGVRTH